MICGAADEGSAALFVCGGGRDGSGSGAVAPAAQTGAVASAPEPDPGVGGREEWSGSARRADRREIVVCGRGECVGGRGEGLDSPGGRIGVSLLTGAKFGDRMKKIFSEFFVLDFMRTEKFREDIV